MEEDPRCLTHGPASVSAQHLGPITQARHGRVSIFGPDSHLLARWGTPDATAVGSFAAPHGLAVDAKCAVYVSEVTWTFAVSRGRAPADCHTFQKFSLQS